MKKNLLPWQLLTLVALLLPTAYLAFVWPGLPDQVPTHFGIDGHADSFSSRDHLWLLTLALPVGIALLFSAAPYLDPKRRLVGDTANFQKLRLALVGFVSGLACFCLYLAVHPGTSPGRGIALLSGLFLTLIGNYLTTVQPNYFVGIRTPWTLESPSVWARTHRAGGILFCLSGVLIVALALFLPQPWLPTAALMITVGAVAFSYLYSYAISRQKERFQNPEIL